MTAIIYETVDDPVHSMRQHLNVLDRPPDEALAQPQVGLSPTSASSVVFAVTIIDLPSGDDSKATHNDDEVVNVAFQTVLPLHRLETDKVELAEPDMVVVAVVEFDGEAHADVIDYVDGAAQQEQNQDFDGIVAWLDSVVLPTAEVVADVVADPDGGMPLTSVDFDVMPGDGVGNPDSHPHPGGFDAAAAGHDDDIQDQEGFHVHHILYTVDHFYCGLAAVSSPSMDVHDIFPAPVAARRPLIRIYFALPAYVEETADGAATAFVGVVAPPPSPAELEDDSAAYF